MRGSTTNDITRFTAMTTTSGSAASGHRRFLSVACERCISAGSNSRATVARSRTSGSSAAASTGTARHRPEAFAGVSPRASCRSQPPQAEAEHDGRGDHAEPGCREGRGAEERHRDGVLDRRRSRQRRHGEGEVPDRDGAAGIRRRGMPASRNSAVAMGASTKKATNRLTPP
jgi:hypothetical protein